MFWEKKIFFVLICFGNFFGGGFLLFVLLSCFLLWFNVIYPRGGQVSAWLNLYSNNQKGDTKMSHRIEELKAEVKRMAVYLEAKIKIAERSRDKAYNLPWGLGHAYVETSRDRSDDNLFEAKNKVISYGKSIWTIYSYLDVSECKELVETYLGIIGKYIPDDQISEIRKSGTRERR